MTDHDNKLTLAAYVQERISELQKTSGISTPLGPVPGAREVRTLTLIAGGELRMAIDKVGTFARLLHCDPHELMRLALKQFFEEDDMRLILDTGAHAAGVDRNEAWAAVTATAANLRMVLADLDETTAAVDRLTRRVGENFERVHTIAIQIEKVAARLNDSKTPTPPAA